MLGRRHFSAATSGCRRACAPAPTMPAQRSPLPLSQELEEQIAAGAAPHREAAEREAAAAAEREAALREAVAAAERRAEGLAAELLRRGRAAEVQAAAVREVEAANRGLRAAWRRGEAALAEAVRARRATEESKLELVAALIEERAARLLAQQAGGSERARLALDADERRTLGLVLDAVRELQAGSGGGSGGGGEMH